MRIRTPKKNKQVLLPQFSPVEKDLVQKHEDLMEKMMKKEEKKQEKINKAGKKKVRK